MIFVGSFKEQAADGTVGGQTFACQTLMRSPFSDHVDIIPLDSTMESLPVPSFARRMYLALLRLGRFMNLVLFGKVDGALIFAGDGLSFLEKGVMVAIARCGSKWTILCPRSGLLRNNLDSSRVMRWITPRILKLADRIVCQGESWKHLFQDLTQLPDHRFVVIKNWIDPTPYTDLPQPEPNSDRFNVLFLGWIEHNKGVHDIVEMVQRFRQSLDGVYFVMCGGGSQLSEVKRRVAALGLDEYFEFPGWVTGEKKRSALQAGHVFILPSYREGMPNALLEAMAAGRPVVATRVGGIPDLVPDESLGYLIEPGNVLALGSTILTLLNDPEKRATMGRSARSHVAAHHAVDQAWRKIVDTIWDVRRQHI